jgi:voltage-gated potassium channel
MSFQAESSHVFRRARHSILVALNCFVIVMAGGTIGYKQFGGDALSWMDALYMTFLMVTTIGYGAGLDIFHRPEREIFTMIVAFSGVGVMTYFFSSVTALVLASDFDKTLHRRRMEKMMKKVTGHYILCGFGRVGRNVANELESTNHHYVGIDVNLAVLEAYSDKKPGFLFIHGDTSDDDTLLQANIEEAKGVFAITDDDSRNLMISLSAKQLNPNVRVVARCNSVSNVQKLKKAGADEIVSLNFAGGMRIASAMLRPQAVSFLDEMLFSVNKLRVEQVQTPPHFKPRALFTLKLRSENYVLLAVRTTTEWLFNPPADFMVQPEHLLIAMASPQGRLELEQLVQQLAENDAL